MSTATLTTTAFGQSISVTANWSQDASPITGDLGGYQVVDVDTPQEALRRALENLVENSGDDPEDFEDAIEAAVAAAVWA